MDAEAPPATRRGHTDQETVPRKRVTSRWLNIKSGPIALLFYVTVRLTVFLFQCFPINLNLKTARLLGLIWWYFFPVYRRRAQQHLRLAYGDRLSPAELDRIALRSMQQLAMVAVELLFTPRLVNAWTWRRYVRLTHFDEALRVLLAGRGAILVTGHYGNWELTGHLLAVYGFEVVAIMRPLDNIRLNRHVVSTRRAAGLRLLDKKGAAKEVEEILRRGGCVGFIADQDAGRKGVFVDFFGQPASTYKSIALLAIHADVPIIVGYARRIGDDYQYELGVRRVIQPAEWGDHPDPVRWITQEYTSAIEQIVREDPTQYLWLHRRWKSRPRSERLTAVRGPGEPISRAR